jgi:hypothetical protein
VVSILGMYKSTSTLSISSKLFYDTCSDRKRPASPPSQLTHNRFDDTAPTTGVHHEKCHACKVQHTEYGCLERRESLGQQQLTFRFSISCGVPPSSVDAGELETDLVRCEVVPHGAHKVKHAEWFTHQLAIHPLWCLPSNKPTDPRQPGDRPANRRRPNRTNGHDDGVVTRFTNHDNVCGQNERTRINERRRCFFFTLYEGGFFTYIGYDRTHDVHIQFTMVRCMVIQCTRMSSPRDQLNR